MQIVINISEELYTRAGCDDDVMDNTDDMIGILDAICGGKILPEYHGRLIDADAYRKEMLDSREFDFFKRLDMQPTIIEANTESEG